MIRQHGELVPIPDTEPARARARPSRCCSTCSPTSASSRSSGSEHEVDFSYALPGVARFRVNAFKQRGSVSMVCRAIPFEIKIGRAS